MTDYTTGTITLTSGSAAFTTSGAALQSAGIKPGDMIIRVGGVLVIATITGENSGTLVENCTSWQAGTNVPLRIRPQGGASQVSAQTATLIALLSGGNLASMAGLTPAGPVSELVALSSGGTASLLLPSAIMLTPTTQVTWEDSPTARARAEMLPEEWRVRVNDGTTWRYGFSIDRATGKVKLGGQPFMNFAALNIQGRALTGTGNSFFAICTTQSSSNNSNKGGMTLIGAPYTNDHLPMSMLGSWSQVDNSWMYYGGGSWGASDVTQHRFYASAHNPNTANTGTLALTIDNASIDAFRALRPSADNSFSLGASGRRWSVVWAATGTINTSDGREKDIEGVVPLGLDFVNALEPVAYKWKVGGHDMVQEWIDDPGGKTDADGQVVKERVDVPLPKPGSRLHYGLIAQQVKEQLDAFGIDDFAGWTLADKDDPDSQQGLRYDQFVPILIRAVQELSARLAVMEGGGEPA